MSLELSGEHCRAFRVREELLVDLSTQHTIVTHQTLILSVCETLRRVTHRRIRNLIRAIENLIISHQLKRILPSPIISHTEITRRTIIKHPICPVATNTVYTEPPTTTTSRISCLIAVEANNLTHNERPSSEADRTPPTIELLGDSERILGLRLKERHHRLLIHNPSSLNPRTGLTHSTLIIIQASLHSIPQNRINRKTNPKLRKLITDIMCPDRRLRMISAQEGTDSLRRTTTLTQRYPISSRHTGNMLPRLLLSQVYKLHSTIDPKQTSTTLRANG